MIPTTRSTNLELARRRLRGARGCLCSPRRDVRRWARTIDRPYSAAVGFARAGLDVQAWQPGAHPLERKLTWPERGLTVLELDAGFEDPNVCMNGHLIYVLEGTLELVLEGGVERLPAGEACTLDPGTGHRARNAGSGSLRLLVLARPGL